MIRNFVNSLILSVHGTSHVQVYTMGLFNRIQFIHCLLFISLIKEYKIRKTPHIYAQVCQLTNFCTLNDIKIVHTFSRQR